MGASAHRMSATRPQERSLFAKLNKKYKKQVNVAKCPAPAKAS